MKVIGSETHVAGNIYSFSGSRLPEVLCKKVALKNFSKFTGKHLCQSFFLNKVAR